MTKTADVLMNTISEIRKLEKRSTEICYMKIYKFTILSSLNDVLLTAAFCLWAGSALAAGPSFDCGSVEAGSIEEMVCKDAGLAALDRKLAEVYAAASQKTVSEQPPVLKAEQRGWIKGRNECWKSDDKRGCVRDEYQPRIAELQARYRLVPGNGPVRFMCDGNPANVDRRARRQRLADVLAAERQRRKVSGPQRDLLGPSRRSVDQVGYGAPEKRCKKAP